MENTLGKRILQNRKRLGLTQDALAEKLGITAQAVSKWENDQSCPDVTMLPRLAEIFGITTDSLLGLEAPAKEAEVVTEEISGLHIDKEDDRFEFSWDGGRKSYTALGVWVISAAVMMLAANFLEQYVNVWTALWTTGLTLYGIFGLWPKFSIFRLGCALVGGYIAVGELWPGFFVLNETYILPVLLLLFGLRLLADAGKKNKNPRFHMASRGKDKRISEYQVEGGTFSCEVTFGSRSQLVELPRLTQGEVEVSFGELTLDLRGCTEFAPGCQLDLECSFGELTVLLPGSVRAEPSSSTAFGSFHVTGTPNPDAATVLLVSAEANFGEVTLQYL